MQPYSVFKATSSLGSNVYFVNTSPAVIIDTGHPFFALQTLELLSKSVPLEKAAFLFCTHSHPDHVGAASLIKQSTTVQLYCLPVAKNDKLTPLHQSLLKLDSEFPPIDRYLVDKELIELDDDTIQIISTPGHSDDHCCFYFSKRRFLFTGDLIANEDIGFLNLNKPYQIAMNELRQSLQKCANISARLVFPGHGDPYRIAPWSRLQRKLLLLEKNPRLLIAHTLISPLLFYLWIRKSMSLGECEQYIAEHSYLFDDFLPDITVDIILHEYRRLLSLLEMKNVLSLAGNNLVSRFHDEIKSQWFKY